MEAKAIIKVDEIKLKNKFFAYDGCHKIYLLDNESQKEEAENLGYSIYPIEKIEIVYNKSCELRFISTWDLDKVVEQFQEVEFSNT